MGEITAAAERWMAPASSWERKEKRGPVLTGEKREREKTRRPTKRGAPGCFSASRPIKRGQAEVEVKLHDWDLLCLCFLHDDPSGVFSDFTPVRASIKKKKKRKITVCE